MIGYRAWGALLARRLSIAGVLVACVDYGNFPLSAQDVSDDAVWTSGHPACSATSCACLLAVDRLRAMCYAEPESHHCS